MLACHGDTYLTSVRVVRVPARPGVKGSVVRGICDAVGSQNDWTEKRAGRSWSLARLKVELKENVELEGVVTFHQSWHGKCHLRWRLRGVTVPNRWKMALAVFTLQDNSQACQ